MRLYFIILTLFLSLSSYAQQFEVLPLGVYGGGDESNLSSYLIRDFKQSNYIACDAGTLRAGLIAAAAKGNLEEEPMEVLRHNVKAYFISHSHLDHLSGLLINSPEDTAKPIYAFPETVETFKNHYFIQDTWANFTDEGEAPRLNKYQYKTLSEKETYSIEKTGLKLTAFPLSHPVPSAAAWLHNNSGYSILYLGDTGPDSVEGSKHLENLWKAVAEDLKTDKLKAIFIEVSFANAQPDTLLFGHLTPNYLVEELQQLASFAGEESLKDFPIVVTHIKPDGESMEVIKKELQDSNVLGVHYIFPEQGVPLEF